MLTYLFMQRFNVLNQNLCVTYILIITAKLVLGGNSNF